MIGTTKVDQDKMWFTGEVLNVSLLHSRPFEAGMITATQFLSFTYNSLRDFLAKKLGFDSLVSPRTSLFKNSFFNVPCLLHSGQP